MRFRFLLVVCVAAACDGGGKPPAVVERVLDGDTIELTNGTVVRLLGVDTPERSGPAECWAEDAYTFTDTKLDGRTVKLEYDVERFDTFGRTLAWVHLGEELVNATLVSEGHACVLIIPPNGQSRATYLEALQQQAMSANRGLWAACGGCDTPAFDLTRGLRPLGGGADAPPAPPGGD